MVEDSKLAVRHNEGKTNFVLIPWEWLQVLAEIFTFGAKKYAPRNWQKSLNTQDHDKFCEDRLDSTMRHMVAHMRGERLDPESGRPHTDHSAWNLLCVMWYNMNDKRK